MKIFFSKDNQLSETESLEKCCRLDVLVEIEGKYFHPYITMVVRILQEVEDAVLNNDIYHNDSCQIIVHAVDKQSIVDSILYHYEHNFFDSFVPIDLKKSIDFSSTPYSDISNWVVIYDSEKTDKI